MPSTLLTSVTPSMEMGLNSGIDMSVALASENGPVPPVTAVTIVRAGR
jgi:hypothetical protein